MEGAYRLSRKPNPLRARSGRSERPGDLVRLASERDVDAWQQQPLTADEQALTAVEDWGPVEDWTDFDATR